MEKGGSSCNHTFVQGEEASDGSYGNQGKLLNSKVDFLTAIKAWQ
jgi:hypothetical protein